MFRLIFWILKRFGWKIDENPPARVQKAVIVMGPHTSNWDFIIGRAAFAKYGMPAKFLIKKDLFFFPLGFFLKQLGGVPVDRNKRNNVTSEAVKMFQKEESLYLVFTPEGTRSYNDNWKKGFYFIASEAKVPIYIGYLDYKRKQGGFHSLFEPTGDVDADIKVIKTILSVYSGRFPENGIKKPE